MTIQFFVRNQYGLSGLPQSIELDVVPRIGEKVVAFRNYRVVDVIHDYDESNVRIILETTP